MKLTLSAVAVVVITGVVAAVSVSVLGAAGHLTPVQMCVNPGGLVRAVDGADDCKRNESPLALASFADLQALESKVAAIQQPEVIAVAESEPKLLDQTGQFVELASVQLDGGDSVLVTAFVEVNAKDCVQITDITTQVLLDGQVVATYPAMTMSANPGTYIVPGLGGQIDPGIYGAGPHTVSLQAADGSLNGYATVEDRNLNAVVIGSTY